MKILYKAKRYEEMLDSYRSMLAYLEGTVVTKNASEKKVNSLLDFMGQVCGMWFSGASSMSRSLLWIRSVECALDPDAEDPRCGVASILHPVG